MINIYWISASKSLPELYIQSRKSRNYQQLGLTSGRGAGYTIYQSPIS